MADFNPKTSIDQGKEYDFRGTSGNRALGTLLSGVAEIGDAGIGAVHRLIGEKISTDARAGEEQIQDNLFNTGKVAVAQASTTKAGMAMPEDLSKGFNEALRLKKAYMKGAIRESDYLANVDVLAKKLRSKYGSLWSDEIDSAIGNAVNSTANAFRKQLFNEWDTEIKAAQDAAKDKSSFVEKHLDHFAGTDMLVNPQNYSIAQLRAYAAPREARKTRVQQEMAELNLIDKDDEMRTLKQRRALSTVMSQGLSSMLDKQGKPVVQAWYEAVQKAQADGHISKEEKNLLTQNAMALEQQVRGLHTKLINDPAFSDMSADDKSKELDLALQNVKAVMNTMTDEKIGLFHYNTEQYKSGMDDIIESNMKKYPELATTYAVTNMLQRLGLDSFANTQLTDQMQGTYKSMQTKSTNAGAPNGFSLFARGLIDPNAYNEYTEALANDPSSGDIGKVPYGVELSLKAVTDPEVPLEGKLRAARAVFQPGPRNFLQHYNEYPGHRDASNFYYSIVRPDVVKALSEIMKVDPQTWGNFRTWAVDEGFGYLFGIDVNQMVADQEKRTSIVTGKQTSPGSQITYNSQKKQFEQPPKKGDIFGNVQREWEVNQDRIDRLNAWTKAITPILEAEGLDPVNELTRIFQERGLMKIKGLESEEAEGDKKAKTE